MSHFSRHRRVAGAIAGLAALLGAEGLLWAVSRRAARAAECDLGQKVREQRALGSQTPAPTAARAAAIAADLAHAEADLRAVGGRLWDRDAPPPRPPASPTDAFFDLTGSVRALGEQAARAGVGVKDGERFGFATYSHDGPPLRLVPAIDRQRRIAAALLQALLAARPHRIESVQRENPEPGGRTPSRAGGGDGTVPNDFFALDPRISLRAPDAVATTPFRLVFTGPSAALRRLLNRLAAGDTPAVVRSVMVEPSGAAPPARSAKSGAREPLALVVRAASSRFAVTVEFCDILGPPIAPGERSGPALEGVGGSGPWPEPASQLRGREWLYDLFTPPAVYFNPQRPELRAASADPVIANSEETRPDLELLRVRRRPFRVQLIGYAGRPDDLRGIFADSASGETVVARAGDHLAGQRITVRQLALERLSDGAEGGSAQEPAAIATVMEDGAGGEIRLHTREPCLAGPPVGIFGSRRVAGLRREAEAGESFVLEGASYCVEQIDVQPPEATVACTPPDGAGPPVRRILHPRDPPEIDEAPGRSAAGQSAATFQNTP